MPAASRTGTTLPGDDGADTTGSIRLVSYSRTEVYPASGSAKTGSNGRLARGRTQSSTVASGSMMPFLAPASTAMLAMLNRSSIVRCVRASPANSIAQ